MNDEMICLSVPNFSGNERKYVDEAIDTEWVSTAGRAINMFEENIAKMLCVKDACACQSGTAGLHLCLRHFGVGAGDIVLVPTLTFIATINAVMYQSASPVFFDCDDNMCIDAKQVENYLANECICKNGRTVEKASEKTVKAIIPVHVFGDLCDMDRLMEIGNKYGLYIIEDATEALGGVFDTGRYSGKCAGTVGHAGVFSFNGNKIITTGGGGMVASDDKNAIEHIRYLSQQAKDDTMYFVHEEYGYNYRMTNLQAALGLAQLEQLDGFVKTKRRNHEMYRELLANCDYGYVKDFSCKTTNCWFYSFVLNEPNSEKRDKLIKCLNEHKIQVRPIWKLNHTQTPFKQFRALDCSNAQRFYDSVINIPCNTNLTSEQIKRVASEILGMGRKV